MLGFFIKSGTFCLFLQIPLFSYSSYEIKYEPIERRCTLFVNYEYIAHTDLNTNSNACFFYLLDNSYEKCDKTHSKNSKSSKIDKSQIYLEFERLDKVSFVGYYCR